MRPRRARRPRAQEAERRRNERARRFGVEEEEDDKDDEKTVDIESMKKYVRYDSLVDASNICFSVPE